MVDRIKRLENLFLEEINSLVSRLIASGHFSGFITLTGVRISKDLTSAKVFYSVFGNDADKKNAAAQLAKLRGEIGAALRSRVHIKRIPSFAFELDDTPQRASAVEKIFAKIEKEHEQK